MSDMTVWLDVFCCSQQYVIVDLRSSLYCCVCVCVCVRVSNSSLFHFVCVCVCVFERHTVCVLYCTVLLWDFFIHNEI